MVQRPLQFLSYVNGSSVICTDRKGKARNVVDTSMLLLVVIPGSSWLLSLSPLWTLVFVSLCSPPET